MLSQSESFQEVIDTVKRAKEEIVHMLKTHAVEIRAQIEQQQILYKKQKGKALKEEALYKKGQTIPIRKRRKR